MRHPIYSLLALGSISVVSAIDPLSDTVLDRVISLAISSSIYSWENGTLARALTEYYVPSISPFTENFLTNDPNPSNSTITSQLILIAQSTLAHKQASFGQSSTSGNWTLSAGKSLSLLDDDSAADPASLGEVVSWYNQTQSDTQAYGVAYLLQVVPRSSTGAISHRADQFQYWSDFAYMVPPFLAYMGALENNQTLVTEAYNQLGLYRGALKQSNGLWKHIQQGSGSIDNGAWTTGNGWAAAGMLRVIAIIQNSGMANSFTNQIADLKSWISEILTGAYAHELTTGLLHNYADNSSTFIDSTGAIILASVAYRLSAMGITSVWVPFAERTYANVSAGVASSDGWVAPVVNSLDWSKQGQTSPEAQSFVILMETGRRAWVSAGSTNASGSAGTGENPNQSTATRGMFVPALSVSRGLLFGLIFVILSAI
ncbi:Six-hairpin glycosidase-like [Phaffia rhodozyma]|uniref:Six-hairpin glycosidase-like n=1 Tax=Phaffia rhodozyma TaxID=264483 RepID=A0A0F7SMP5_PHARH|nr:Six-hairpin glycosidase-like [Phaffia rhodozyma]